MDVNCKTISDSGNYTVDTETKSTDYADHNHYHVGYVHYTMECVV